MNGQQRCSADERRTRCARLLEHDLVDELRLMFDPLLVAGGKRFAHDNGALRRFRLVDHEVATTGAILATYARAEA